MTLLPGQTLINGVSNYIFGTNLGQRVSTNGVLVTPAIQAKVKAGNFQIMRCGIASGKPDSFIDSVVAAVNACGCKMMVILSLYDIAWNSHLISYLGSNCLIYEFGNEPDGAAKGHLNGTQYYAYWSAQIPTLRALNPSAVFIGPTVTYGALSTTFIPDWLTLCQTAGGSMLPDGISYHHYPCTTVPGSSSACNLRNAIFSADAATINSQVTGVLGHTLPICLTEWNIAGGTPPPAYTQDFAFATNWIYPAIDSMIAGGLAMACQFEAGTGEGAGGLDMISVVSPFDAWVDYQPIVDKNIQYLQTGSGSSNPSLTVTPTTLTFNATVGGGNPASQTVKITNTYSAAETYTATIQNSASWLSVSPASALLAATVNGTSTLSVNITGLIPATYIATVVYQTGSMTVPVTVRLVLQGTGGGGGGGGNAPATPATPPYTAYSNGIAYPVIAGSLNVDSAIGRRSMAYFTIHQRDTTTHFQQDQQVQIVGSNGAPAFNGYITLPRESKPGFQSSLDHQIQAADQHRLADKRIIARSYTGKSASYIVQDIFNTVLSTEGVSIGQIFDGPLPNEYHFPSTTLYPNTTLYPTYPLYPSTTLYPNGSDNIIPKAVFAYCNIAQALDALVAQTTSGSIPYYWQIDQNKNLFFVPYSAIVNSTVIDGTAIDNGRLSGMKPQVIRANPTYRNGQYLTGGVDVTVPQVAFLDGNGSSTNFTLNFDVNSISKIMLNGSISKTFGIKGVDTGKNYYYAVGDPVIVADASEPILQGATATSNPDLLEVHYIGQFPSVFYSQNTVQVAYEQALDGSSGIVESVQQDSTVVGASQGFTRNSELLQRYGVQATQFKFNTLVSSYQPGQMATVTYPPHGFNNTQMLIEQVTASDAHDGLNCWYTVYCIAGPYDMTWVSFFSNLIQQAASATANINVGISSSVAILAQFYSAIVVRGIMTATLQVLPTPSTTLFPSTTLYAG